MKQDDKWCYEYHDFWQRYFVIDEVKIVYKYRCRLLFNDELIKKSNNYRKKLFLYNL